MIKKEQQKLTPALIFVLIVGSVFFTATILYIEEYINKKAQTKALEEVSKAYSTSIQSFRDFYSKVILDKLHGSNIEISHNYISKEHSVPIPATMTIDLISFLNNNNAKANLSLVSEYPFTWRENRILSDFDKEALHYFRTTSKDSYSKLTSIDDENIFQYATPIRMQKNCVSCHNTHPQSPKTDWKVGDIRGVQVINLEPEVIDVNNIEDRIYFIIATLLFFTFNISIIVWLLQRNNFAFNLLMKDKRKITEALDTAKKANKTKDDFLANISHEVRTPLNAIIGFADILTEAKLAKTEHEQAKIISTSAKSLLAIINDILDFSKMESGKFEIKPEVASLNEMSQNIFNLFNVKASEKNILLDFQFDKSIPPFLDFDALRLQQVVSNLLGNAIKFTPERGTINFNVQLLNINNNEAEILFVIKDNGIGIAKEKQELIFKPFSQADNSVTKQFGGTGLGLTIINTILQMMNSKIDLESHEKKGSTFSFKLQLPISNKIQQESLKNKTKQEEFNTTSKILVAEDNPINQKLLQAMLSKQNLVADYANDGLEALAFYKSNRYDLIFMDINMPNCDGVEATAKIREYEAENTLNATPIIALTANAIKGDKEKYIAHGMTSYIDKPISADKLSNALVTYLVKEEPKVESNYQLSEAIENLQLDEENLRVLIENFFETLDDDLNQLEVAINSKQAHDIYKAAHYIKGASANFCMNDVAKLLEAYETKAQCGETTGYDINKVRDLFRQIKASLDNT